MGTVHRHPKLAFVVTVAVGGVAIAVGCGAENPETGTLVRAQMSTTAGWTTNVFSELTFVDAEIAEDAPGLYSLEPCVIMPLGPWEAASKSSMLDAQVHFTVPVPSVAGGLETVQDDVPLDAMTFVGDASDPGLVVVETSIPIDGFEPCVVEPVPVDQATASLTISEGNADFTPDQCRGSAIECGDVCCDSVPGCFTDCFVVGGEGRCVVACPN